MTRYRGPWNVTLVSDARFREAVGSVDFIPVAILTKIPLN